jgi:hypothetical protein
MSHATTGKCSKHQLVIEIPIGTALQKIQRAMDYFLGKPFFYIKVTFFEKKIARHSIYY